MGGLSTRIGDRLPDIHTPVRPIREPNIVREAVDAFDGPGRAEAFSSSTAREECGGTAFLYI